MIEELSTETNSDRLIVSSALSKPKFSLTGKMPFRRFISTYYQTVALK